MNTLNTWYQHYLTTNLARGMDRDLAEKRALADACEQMIKPEPYIGLAGGSQPREIGDPMRYGEREFYR